MFHPPGQVHSDRFGSAGGRCLEFSLADDLLDAATGADPGHRPPLGSSMVVPHGAVFRLWREARTVDDLSTGIVEEEIMRLLGILGHLPTLKLGGHPPRWVHRVREWLHQDFVDPPTLAEVAAGVGVHRSHLTRAFRSHYGCTMGAYVRLRRISVAAAALRRSTDSLSRVAFDSGFADQSHMTRTFRDIVGLTPGRFRALAS